MLQRVSREGRRRLLLLCCGVMVTPDHCSVTPDQQPVRTWWLRESMRHVEGDAKLGGNHTAATGGRHPPLVIIIKKKGGGGGWWVGEWIAYWGRRAKGYVCNHSVTFGHQMGGRGAPSVLISCVVVHRKERRPNAMLPDDGVGNRQ